MLSGTAMNVSDALQASCLLTEDVFVQLVLSLMELNAQSNLLIDVLEFLTLTGTVLIVSASQDSRPVEIHASVMVSSLEIIVKDAPQDPTLSGPMESASVTTALSASTVYVPSKLLPVSNATLPLISTPNFKNVSPALMDV